MDDDYGVESLFVAGRTIDVADTLEISLQTEVRETPDSLTSANPGSTVKRKAPFVRVVCFDGASSNYDHFIDNVRNEKVVLNLRNGKIVTWSGATLVGDCDLDVAKGTFEARLNGKRVIKV